MRSTTGADTEDDGGAHCKTNAGIEQALHLSSSTVEKHVSMIFGKLGLADEPVHRRVAAVLTFMRESPRHRTGIGHVPDRRGLA